MKRNLSDIRPEKVFYKYIYPIYAKQFVLGNDYQIFAETVQKDFILSPDQWEVILNEWELKEELLS